MNGKILEELDEEIDKLTQVRSLIAFGVPFSTAKRKPHGLTLVPKRGKVDHRKGRRSPEVIEHMRAAQRKRWARPRKAAQT